MRVNNLLWSFFRGMTSGCVCVCDSQGCTEGLLFGLLTHAPTEYHTSQRCQSDKKAAAMKEMCQIGITMQSLTRRA